MTIVGKVGRFYPERRPRNVGKREGTQSWQGHNRRQEKVSDFQTKRVLNFIHNTARPHSPPGNREPTIRIRIIFTVSRGQRTPCESVTVKRSSTLYAIVLSSFLLPLGLVDYLTFQSSHVLFPCSFSTHGFVRNGNFIVFFSQTI